MNVIRITDVTNSPNFIAHRYGVQVYDRICSCLDRGEKVKVSFEGMETVTASFLSPAIGNLYGRYDKGFLSEHLEITEITDVGRMYPDRVIDVAELYFQDPEQFIKDMNEILDESE